MKNEKWKMTNVKCLRLFATFTQIPLTGAALRAALRIQSSARSATKIHVTRKPRGDDRTNPEDSDQHNCIQKQLSQLLCVSPSVL